MSRAGALRSICVGSSIRGQSGPASFQRRLSSGLSQRSIATHYLPDCGTSQVVLIIGGTRQIPALARAKQSGAIVVQRLNGMNWIHRHRPTGLRHYMKAEWANFNLRFIRRWLADAVVYQSKFVQGWWNRAVGEIEIPTRVIYNGVPLDRFTPLRDKAPTNGIRILLVEGNLAGGYEIGLDWAVRLTARLRQDLEKDVLLAVAGFVPPGLREKLADSGARWLGVLSEEEVVEQHHRAHFLFASDLNAACPNSVVEALACGTPVLAFDTGALSELVDGTSGVLVPYGADPWQAADPDISSLVGAARQVLTDSSRLSAGARRRAEECFSQDGMVEEYLAAFREWLQ